MDNSTEVLDSGSPPFQGKIQHFFKWIVSGMVLLCGLIYIPYLDVGRDFFREAAFLALFMAILVAASFLLIKGNYSFKFGNARNLIFTLLVFQLLIILSTVFSPDPFTAFYGSYYRHMGLVVILPLTIIPFFFIFFRLDRKDLSFILYAVILFISINSICGIFQSFGLDFIGANKSGIKSPFSIRPGGFTGNPDFFAPLILFGIFPTLSYAIEFYYEKKQLRFLLFLFLLLFQMMAIIASMTRGTWAAMVFGAIFYAALLYLCAPSDGKWKRNIIKVTAIAVLVASVSVICSFIFIPKFAPFFGGKIVSIFTLSQKYYYTGEHIPVERIPLWRDTVVFCYESLKNGFVFGIGFENYQRYFMPFKSLELAQISLNKFFDNPHNYYLYILSSCGITGLLAFVAMLIFAFKLAYRNLRKMKGDLLLIGTIASLLAYFINLLTTFEVMQMGILFYVFLGISCVLGTSDNGMKDGIKSKTGFLRPAIAGMTFLLILSTAAGIIDVLRQISADCVFKKGIGEMEAEKPDIDKAIGFFDTACKRYPNEFYYADELMRAMGKKAAILMSQKKFSEGENCYKLSMDLVYKYEKRAHSPAVLYMNAGLNSYRMGYLDNAISMFEKATFWDGWNTNVHSVLGTFYFLRYSVANDPSDLEMAFHHSFTTVRILKYFPHRDPLAFKNSIKYANLIYAKTKNSDLRRPIAETIMNYAKIAKDSQETSEEFSDSLKTVAGSEYENDIKAAEYFLKYRTGKLNQNEAISKIKGLKKGVNQYYEDYIKIIEEGK